MHHDEKDANDFIEAWAKAAKEDADLIYRMQKRNIRAQFTPMQIFMGECLLHAPKIIGAIVAVVVLFAIFG